MTDDLRAQAPALAALVLLDLVAAACIGRLFTSLSSIGPILLAVLAGHTLAVVCRFRRLSVPSTAAATVALGVVLMAWLGAPGETWLGIPSPDALRAIADGLSDARRDFATAVAPTPVTPGFTMACVFACSTLAVLADWGAFRIGATVEAAVPAFTAFVFAAVLGTSAHRSAAALAFCGAALIWFVAHNATIIAKTKPWFTGTMTGGRKALARGGIGIGAIAIVGALVGLALPFAQDPPAVAWRNRGQSQARTTVSPLVDIRTRLVARSDVVAFTVATDLRAYWRLTSLDLFDGRIWSSRGSYKEVKPASLLNHPGKRTRQHFTIRNLTSIWLPAAYQPGTTPNIEDISYDKDSEAFITDADTSDNLDYDVQSVVRSPTAESLRAALPRKVDTSQFVLPRDVDPQVALLAADITRNAPTPYDKALAIQQFFRSGRFTYDLSVGPGHGGDDVVRFLFNTKRGYCEQFAGTFAVLARLAGLPTRVAVGFTAGDRDATTGELVVRELNAHAWPEVFLGSAGWVAFEPTPGRGIPGGEAYTGQADSQADAGTPGAVSTLVPTTEVAAGETGGGSATTTTVPARNQPAAPDRANPLIRAALIALGVLALIAASAAVVPLTVAARRRRRWRSAQDAAERVLVSWDDTVDALVFAGTRVRPSDTPTERVGAAATTLGEGSVALLERLAATVDLAAYAPPGLSADDAERSRADAELIRRAAMATRPTWRGVLYAINPRRLRRQTR